MSDERTPSNTTSYLLDAESPAEMARLINLDQMTTRAMGGPLAEQPTGRREQLHQVLDLGCGPGGWVLDLAYEQPKVEVAGIDISRTMIAYAHARARSQGLNNASFQVMDFMHPLEFTAASFDLINARFLTIALPAAHWPVLLSECMRLLRPGGMLRFTEMIDPGVTTSPAFERIQQLIYQVTKQRGYGFSPLGTGFGISAVMPQLLRHAGYLDVQQQAHALEFSSGTPVWSAFYRNAEVAYYLGQPVLVRAGLITQEEMEHLYMQMLIEMQNETFCGMWHFMTFWATKPA